MKHRIFSGAETVRACNYLSLRNPVSPVRLRVAVAGDFCPGQHGSSLAREGRAPEVLAPLAPFLSDCDLRLVQFETPLTRTAAPIPKTGPNLISSPESADILSQFDALRPSDDKSSEVKDTPASITIKGFPSHPGLGAYMFGNDATRRTVTLEQLRGFAGQMAKANRNQSVIVNCTDSAPHGCLVRVLDLLADAGLHTVSVFSLDNGSEKPW